jgi:hypothetical protein
MGFCGAGSAPTEALPYTPGPPETTVGRAVPLQANLDPSPLSGTLSFPAPRQAFTPASAPSKTTTREIRSHPAILLRGRKVEQRLEDDQDLRVVPALHFHLIVGLADLFPRLRIEGQIGLLALVRDDLEPDRNNRPTAKL